MLKIESDLRCMRVVRGDQLALVTERGWRLVCVMQETEIGTREVERNCPGGGDSHVCNHGYYRGNCTGTLKEITTATMTITKYLVGRPENDVIVDQAAQLENLQAQLDTANFVADEIDKARDVIIEQRDAAFQDIEAQREFVERAREHRQKAEAQARKAEVSLADARSDIQKLTKALAEKVTGE